MVRRAVFGAVLLLLPTPGWCLMRVQPGNAPIEHFDDALWSGLKAVVNDPSRMLFAEGPMSQQVAFYQGDSAALSRVLRAFVAVKMEEHVVILRPGRGESWMQEGTSYDWRLDVDRDGLNPRPDAWPLPVLSVFVGGGVELEQVDVPESVTLVGVDELLERYREALASTDQYVRSRVLYQLPRLDPYSEGTAAVFQQLSAKELSWAPIQKVLTLYQERAADPPEVKTRHRSEVREIREFIFAWKHRRLKLLLPTAVSIVALLLVGTVTRAWLQRRKGR